MSAPIDALAVMALDANHAYHWRREGDTSWSEELATDSHAARAAVAELIEAANRAAIAAVRGDENRPGTIRNTDLDELRAALARVKGGAA